MSDKPRVRLPVVNPPAATLRDDMDEGLRFLHNMAMQMKQELLESQTKLYALIEELLAEGKIDLAEFEERRGRIRERELSRQLLMSFVQLGTIEDKYQQPGVPDLDCRAIIPICQARCCKLTFFLSKQDLDERTIEWDYSAPYRIRHNEEGRCVHQHAEEHVCTVYEKRPGLCRSYDCRKDKRIWKDFENKIPNDLPELITGRARGASSP